MCSRAIDTEKELFKWAKQYGFAVKDLERESFLSFVPSNLNTDYDLRLLEFTMEQDTCLAAIEWIGEAEIAESSSAC